MRNRREDKVSIFGAHRRSRKDSILDISHGTEETDASFDWDLFGDCVDKKRFDLGTLVTTSNVANPLGNLIAGKTSRSGFGIGRHATSWLHKGGNYLSKKYGIKALDKIGKIAGRAALPLTLIEGFYDIGVMAGCASINYELQEINSDNSDDADE